MTALPVLNALLMAVRASAAMSASRSARDPAEARSLKDLVSGSNHRKTARSPPAKASAWSTTSAASRASSVAPPAATATAWRAAAHLTSSDVRLPALTGPSHAALYNDLIYIAIHFITGHD